MANPGLYTFKSLHDDSLATYYFPPVTGEDRRIFHINRAGTGLQDIDHMEGSFLTQGTAPMGPGYGELTVTFDFLPPWLKYNQNRGTVEQGSNGYGSYGLGPSGIDLALDDFFKYVVAGGLGLLVDNYATSNGGVSSRTAKAIVGADLTVTRFPGATHAQLETTFFIPSGKWENGMYFH
jgi:hypothetical protein